MKRNLLFGLLLLFFLGFIVRFYRFDNPVADWHSFRQGDTNAVSSRYVREGINFLSPKYYDISNVQSGFDNPQGLRLVEFPIYNATQAVLFEGIGVMTLPEWGRIITIVASIFSAVFIYALTKKYANEIAGVAAAAFFLFLPFSIYYSRVILPDPSMAASILAGIYFFDKWLEKKPKNKNLRTKNGMYFVLSLIFTTLSFLLKPYALFFTLPMVYLVINKWGLSFIKKWQLWLYLVLSILPLALWRVWIGHHPEGIPVSAWLFNGNNIRFHPAFFRWILYERLTKLILGFSGISFFLLGLIDSLKEKNKWFFLTFAISSLLYVCIIATGNVQHDYYQILIVPTISIFAGLGFSKLVSLLSKKIPQNASLAICVLIMISSFVLSWHYVKDYFNINDRGMVAAGVYANKVLPKDAVVIAPYDGSTTFLNIIERPGWPVFEVGINGLIDKGAQYLVIANPTQSDFNGFGRTYTPVASSSTYLILKLK
ncbi:MAG TPA: glycosyltransferase family 39 protein [Patescibacteria group bacterium]|nr:glycosyltransferase family 39 protein [Patescibacteria group bacterium]